MLLNRCSGRAPDSPAYAGRGLPGVRASAAPARNCVAAYRSQALAVQEQLGARVEERGVVSSVRSVGGPAASVPFPGSS